MDKVCFPDGSDAQPEANTCDPFSLDHSGVFREGDHQVALAWFEQRKLFRLTHPCPRFECWG